MDSFLFVYRNKAGYHAQLTPEERQQELQKWHTWIGDALQTGWMLNPGNALKKEGKLVRNKHVVTDGPFVEANEIVGGYSIVQADSLESAAELAKGCPGQLTGWTVEVRPVEVFNDNT